MRTRLAQLRRRGVAMLLTTIVLSVATVAAYALLAGGALQSQSSGNELRATEADAMADSGVRIALYYLQNPQLAPGYAALPATQQPIWYWPGATGITIPGLRGSVDVAVTATGPNAFSITSSGCSDGLVSASRGVVRTVRAAVSNAYAINQAVGCNGSLSIPSSMSIGGNVTAVRGTAASTLRLLSSKIYGNAYAAAFTGPCTPNPPGQNIATALANNVAPLPGCAHDYRTYILNNDRSHPYAAAYLSSPILTAAATLGPTASNPLGVYWCDKTVTLEGGVNVNGTLVVQNGNLVVHGVGNTITAGSGMPALVVDGSMQMDLAGEAITVNGVAWLGGGYVNAGLTTLCNITVNGALLVGGGGLDTTYGGTLNVNYTAAQAVAPDLMPNVRVTGWTGPASP